MLTLFLTDGEAVCPKLKITLNPIYLSDFHVFVFYNASNVLIYWANYMQLSDASYELASSS